jgi:hypothetical protein
MIRQHHNKRHTRNRPAIRFEAWISLVLNVSMTLGVKVLLLLTQNSSWISPELARQTK